MNLPKDWMRASEPSEAIARVCLGLTLYLDDALGWARGGAAEALRRFLAAVPPESLSWVTTSALGEWKRVRPQHLEPWIEALAQRRLDRPRHLLWFRIVDDVHTPRCGFSYREVDDARTARTGFLQLLLPATYDALALRRLSLSTVDCGSYWSGVAGYMASWNLDRKAASFWPIHAWCRRYLGLDVQDPDAMAWHARSGLPGVGWLTFVGQRLADAFELTLPDLLQVSGKHIQAQPLERGVLFHAGPAPDLGDLHTLRYPEACAESAHALAKLLVQEPPEFWGQFYDEQDTRKWLRRFLEPEGWS